MIDLNREEDKQATVGTVTFFALLLLFLIIMGLTRCTDTLAEESDGGGVAVSIGNPDDGGLDNSSAEQSEEYTAPVEPAVEEYVPESQVTSDVAEAPPVKKTEPTPPKPKKPATTSTKPVEEKKPDPKKPDPRSQFPGSKKGGTDASGAGKGGDGKGGYKGRPDGTPDGSPDGNGGTGDRGNGPSDGDGTGSGIKGSISGFKVAKVKQPASGSQEQGVIRLRVCVDANGNVIPSEIKYAPDRDPNTSTDVGLRQRAIDAMKQFKFTNTSGSSGGCGYYTFTFKLQ